MSKAIVVLFFICLAKHTRVAGWQYDCQEFDGSTDSCNADVQEELYHSLLQVSIQKEPALSLRSLYNDTSVYGSVHGEFHSPVVRLESISSTLNSDKCKSFYRRDVPRGRTVVDEHVKIFRLATETKENHKSAPPANKFARVLKKIAKDKPPRPASLPPTPFKRMFTYEDDAFPTDYHDFNPEDKWCEMMAIRTPQRPVKVMTAKNVTGRSLMMMPAIWKVASTSLTVMLGKASPQSFGPHISKARCEKGNVLPQCEKHTSFDSDAVSADVHAAIVRSPLERFLASVYEHGEWRVCKDKDDQDVPCESTVLHARSVAKRLEQEFPHIWRSCEHPTQSYFLSATDLHGQPYKWDLLTRLEEFDSTGKSELERVSGLRFSETKHDNPSGPSHIKKMYFDAIYSDLETLCSICKVYEQDFECLGYVKPEKCTRDSCAEAGITLRGE